MSLSKAELIKRIDEQLAILNEPFKLKGLPIVLEGHIEKEGKLVPPSKKQLELALQWLHSMNNIWRDRYLEIYNQKHVSSVYWDSVAAIGITCSSLQNQIPVKAMLKFIKEYNTAVRHKCRPVVLGGKGARK